MRAIYQDRVARTTMRVLLLLSGAGAATPVLAESWMQTTAPVANWTTTCCAADGRIVAAGVGGGGIYLSTNSGLSWIQSGAPIAAWEGLVCSADASTLAAVAEGWLYLSTNTGQSWTLITLPEHVQASLGISADGTKIGVVSTNQRFGPGFEGQCFLSADAGKSWVSRGLPFITWGISCSADGATLGIRVRGSLHLSKNFGETWESAQPPGVFYVQEFAFSSDASDIIATGHYLYDGGVRFSTNSGSAWFTADLAQEAWNPAISADGRKSVVISSPGAPSALYTSANWGRTWAEGPSPPPNYTAFCFTADGGRLIACVRGGGIYILESLPEPELRIFASETGVTLSWLVPSTRFALHQSPSLSETEWQKIGEAPVLNFKNLHYEVAVPLQPQPMFFRLLSK